MVAHSPTIWGEGESYSRILVFSVLLYFTFNPKKVGALPEVDRIGMCVDAMGARMERVYYRAIYFLSGIQPRSEQVQIWTSGLAF